MTSESCLLQRVSRFMRLSDDDRSAIRELERDTSDVPASRPVVPLGSPGGRLQVIQSGWAVARSAPVRGRTAILRIFLPGDVIGLGEIATGQAAHEVRMQTRGVVATVPDDRLALLMEERPRIMGVLLALASKDVLALRDQCAALSLMPAEDRLLRFFLSLRSRLAVTDPTLGDRFHMPLSQAEIGDAVGMTPVYVNKLLRKLSAEGRISVEKPYVQLLDRAGMEAQAGFVDRHADTGSTLFSTAQVA